MLKVCLPALRRFWVALLALRWAADAWPMKPERVEARRQVLDNFIVCVDCSMSMTLSLRLDYEWWVWFFHFGTPSTFTRVFSHEWEIPMMLSQNDRVYQACNTATIFPVIIIHWIPMHLYLGRAFSNMMTMCLGLAHEEVGSFLAFCTFGFPQSLDRSIAWGQYRATNSDYKMRTKWSSWSTTFPSNSTFCFFEFC